jgi:hypothetical protein
MGRAPPISTTMADQFYSTHEHILVKRQKKKTISDFFNKDVLTCRLPRGVGVEIPTHPGPAMVTNIEKMDPGRRNADEKALLATMKRWYIGRQDRQALASLTKINTGQLPRGGSNNERVFVGGGRKPMVTVDHICMFTSTYYIDFSIILIFGLF